MRNQTDCHLLYAAFVLLLLLGSVSRSNARPRTNRCKYPYQFPENLGLELEHCNLLATIVEIFVDFIDDECN